MAKKNITDLQRGDNQEKEAGWLRFLHFLPEDIRNSFTEQQLIALKAAITAERWNKHTFDIRSSMSLFSYRYYYVLIAGREQRTMSRGEPHIRQFFYLFLIVGFFTFSALLGLLLLYLLKSALGIDLFPNFSLGIWSWFKALLQ